MCFLSLVLPGLLVEKIYRPGRPIGPPQPAASNGEFVVADRAGNLVCPRFHAPQP